MTMAKRGISRRCRRPLAQTKARLRLSQARAYLRDLEAWHRGDENRFGRMVNGRGQQLGAPALWLRYVQQILEEPEVQTYQPGVVKRLRRRVERL